MTDTERLINQRLKLKKNLARIRKAHTLPRSLLRLKYRTHYRALVADTFSIAEKLRDLYLFGGFNLEPEHLPHIALFLRRKAAEGHKIRRRAIMAILAGDGQAFYRELNRLRAESRRNLEAVGVYEHPTFRKKAEEVIF